MDVGGSLVSLLAASGPERIWSRLATDPYIIVSTMTRDHSYEVYTLELGPYDTLDELHRELSNHAATFANEVYVREGEVVVSISHSIVEVGGKLFVSAVTTTDLTEEG